MVGGLGVRLADDKLASHDLAVAEPVGAVVAVDALGGAGLAEVVVAVVALVAVVVGAVDGAVALVAVDGHAAQRVVSPGGRLRRGLRLGNSLVSWLLGLLLHYLFTDGVAELRGELGARAVRGDRFGYGIVELGGINGGRDGGSRWRSRGDVELGGGIRRRQKGFLGSSVLGNESTLFEASCQFRASQKRGEEQSYPRWAPEKL